MRNLIAAFAVTILLGAGLVAPALAQSSGSPSGGQVETGKCDIKRAPNFEFPGPFIVYFALDSDEVRPKYREEIRGIVADAKSVFVQQICLWGHADKLGNAAYNEQLALRRAASVRKVMDEFGFPASKIVITSEGEAFDAIENTSLDRQEKDRRVVILLAK